MIISIDDRNGLIAGTVIDTTDDNFSYFVNFQVILDKILGN